MGRLWPEFHEDRGDGATTALFGELDAVFALLREDDRFPALLRRVNRAWDLADDGSLPG